MDELIPVAIESKEANITASSQTIDAFSFTAALLAKAEEMLVTAKGTDAMYYIDGSTPTAANGHVMSADATYRIRGRINLKRFRFIARSGSGTIAVTLFTTKG